MLTSYTCFCLMVGRQIARSFISETGLLGGQGGGVCRLEQPLLHRSKIRTDSPWLIHGNVWQKQYNIVQ